jgi:hypothetical protein
MTRPGTTPSPIRYQAQRLVQHVRWARTQGIRRLIEEDELDPVARVVGAGRRLAWRQHHGGQPGTAVPLFVVGAQRSGTNMVFRALGRAPEVEVHNENDHAAFDRFLLRSDRTVARIVHDSRHLVVAFKPLCDSGRVDLLLDELPYAVAGRAIWVYRNVDDRARSAVAKFGDSNLRALRAIATGSGGGSWQAQGMSHNTLELLHAFDFASMAPETAAALFWYVRNVLFFERGLHHRADVGLLCYDRLVADPVGVLAPAFGWLGITWRDSYVDDVEPRSASAAARPPLPIDPAVRRLCDQLAARLEECVGRGWVQR